MYIMYKTGAAYVYSYMYIGLIPRRLKHIIPFVCVSAVRKSIAAESGHCEVWGIHYNDVSQTSLTSASTYKRAVMVVV